MTIALYATRAKLKFGMGDIGFVKFSTPDKIEDKIPNCLAFVPRQPGPIGLTKTFSNPDDWAVMFEFEKRESLEVVIHVMNKMLKCWPKAKKKTKARKK